MTNQQKNVLIPLRIAGLCLILFMLETGILEDWHQIAFANHHMIPFLITSFIVFLVLLLLGTISVSLMISRTNFELSELKMVFIPEIVLLSGMLVSVVLSVLFMILLISNAPQLFTTQDVGSTLFIKGIILMALSAFFAAIGLKRGKKMDQFAYI